MKFRYLTLLFALVLFSCGSNKNLKDRANVVEESSRRVLKNHGKSNFDKDFLSADLKIRFEKGKTKQNLTVKMRIQNDSTIWLSGSFFGFPVAKAIITPNRVSYYVKINKTYFDGDFSTLSKLLGTELNYDMMQNLLLGDAIFDLKSSNYSSTIDKQAHLLSPKKNLDAAKILFWFNPLNYKVERQEIKHFSAKKFLSIEYPNYKKLGDTHIPSNIEILANSNTERAKIDIQYKSVKLEKSLTFPYSVPKGYKRVEK
jgi:hypothetical protein